MNTKLKELKITLSKLGKEKSGISDYSDGYVSAVQDAIYEIDKVIKQTDWDLRKRFEQLRFDKNHHLGMGDIRLTIGQQEEICELVDRSYRYC